MSSPKIAEQAAEERRQHDAALREKGVDGNAYSKSKFNQTYALRLMDLYNAYPNRIGHTKEYVPYFQGYGAADPIVNNIEDAEAIIAETLERQRDALDEGWYK